MAAFPQSPGHLYGLLSGLNAIAPTFSIGVAGAFWLLLPAERQSKDLVSLHQHGFLAIITVIDLLICAAPFRYFHILSTWIFAGAYAINTMLVYYIFGTLLIFWENKSRFLKQAVTLVMRGVPALREIAGTSVLPVQRVAPFRLHQYLLYRKSYFTQLIQLIWIYNVTNFDKEVNRIKNLIFFFRNQSRRNLPIFGLSR